MLSTLLARRIGQRCSTSIRLGYSRWLQACLSAVIGALAPGSTATAAEQISLKYGAEERTFPVRNIESFIQTGEAVDPELQSFLERRAEARRILQTIFGAEIYISPGFISRLRERSGSPTVDFVLIQLNKFVNTSAVDNVRGDLQPLRTALVESLEDDNRFSLIELVSRYPESDIQLDLTGLEPVYNDVRGFVERVIPALEVARDYLQNVVCDCEQGQTAQTTTPQATSSTQTISVSTGQPVDCIDAPVTQAPVGQGAADPAIPSVSTMVLSETAATEAALTSSNSNSALSEPTSMGNLSQPMPTTPSQP